LVGRTDEANQAHARADHWIFPADSPTSLNLV
jgi:hypothetical protein